MSSNDKTNHGTLLFLYAETPLHAGAGSGMGAIDLPLQRERMSGLPMIQGSGLKGAWREAFHGQPKEIVEDLFGPEPPGSDSDETEKAENTENSTNGKTYQAWAGAAAFRDARLLLLPLRTVYGGWAWVTCPMVLERLARDLAFFGDDKPSWLDLVPDSDDQALVNTNSAVAQNELLYVEDLAYKAKSENRIDSLATFLQKTLPDEPTYESFKERLTGQLAVLSDGEFRYLASTAMEVNIRIRMDRETGTVEKGGLWSEESFPAESLLWTLVSMTKARRKRGNDTWDASSLVDWFCEVADTQTRIKLGGDQTVGRGVVGVRTCKGGMS